MESIIELIKQRRSIRNYENKPVDTDTINKIYSYINNLEPLFPVKIRFKIIPAVQEFNNIKLGTYGMIKNAPTFIAVAHNVSELSEVAIGYSFEKIVLYCTSLGLGTCWMAGTFKKSAFTKAMELSSDEKLFAVSPLGYSSGKRGIMEKLIGSDSKHGSRKPFEELFFETDWNTPLSQENAGIYEIPLEMVRLAPSAMNKQPWKLLINGDHIAFYLHKAIPNFKVDIGIAMCHFDLSCKELSINGEFKYRTECQNTSPKNYEYIMSWNKLNQ